MTSEFVVHQYRPEEAWKLGVAVGAYTPEYGVGSKEATTVFTPKGVGQPHLEDYVAGEIPQSAAGFTVSTIAKSFRLLCGGILLLKRSPSIDMPNDGPW